MFDEWEASVAVRDASVAVTLEGKRPCDERAIRALHDACARLHTAIARSNLPAGDISLEVSLGARCATCISFERHSKLCGVFSELAHCQVDAEAGPTRILRHSSVPAWHIINTLALELDAASVPVDLANGAMLVHVLEVRCLNAAVRAIHASRAVTGVFDGAIRQRSTALRVNRCGDSKGTLHVLMLRLTIVSQPRRHAVRRCEPAARGSRCCNTSRRRCAPVCKI